MRVAQPVAAWLTLRPQNTVLGLLASLVLPPTPFLGAAVMTFLLLHEDRLQKIALFAAIAVAFMAALNTAFGSSPIGVVRLAALTWIPAVALGVFMRRCRSLTLTVQFSVLVLLVVTLGLFVSMGGGGNTLGQTLVTEVAEVLRTSGYTEQADLLLERQEAAGWQLLGLIVLMLWSSFTLALAAGNAMYGSLREEASGFGAFQHLNMGRVLAGAVALICVGGLAASGLWLQSFAFVAFLVFWVQGLALLHWLHANRSLPKAVVIGVYVLLPFLNMLLVIALATAGYLDAWFGFRRRLAKENAS